MTNLLACFLLHHPVKSEVIDEAENETNTKNVTSETLYL